MQEIGIIELQYVKNFESGSKEKIRIPKNKASHICKYFLNKLCKIKSLLEVLQNIDSLTIRNVPIEHLKIEKFY